MKFRWYKIFDVNEFKKMDVPEIVLDLDFSDDGSKEISIFQLFSGDKNVYGVALENKFLLVNFNDNKQTIKDDISVYFDNNIIYLGFKIEEEGVANI